MDKIQIQIALSNYIKTVSDETDVLVKFELREDELPYTTETVVYMRECDLIAVQDYKSLMLLRAYIAQQISHVMYTNFETIKEIGKHETSLLQTWSDLVAVRSNYHYVKEGFVGDRQTIVLSEENYLRETHDFLKENEKVAVRGLATSKLAYDVRREFLDELQEDPIVALRLANNGLAKKIMKHKKALIDACAETDNKNGAEQILTIARKIVKEEEEEEKEDNEKEESSAGTECVNNEESNKERSGKEEQEPVEIPTKTSIQQEDLESSLKGAPPTPNYSGEVMLDPTASIAKHKITLKEYSAFFVANKKKTFQLSKSEEDFKKLEKQMRVSEDTKSLAKQIRKYLLCKSKTKRRYNLNKGKLNSRALYKITVDEGNRRVFKKKEASQLLDTSVMVLVDNSGSMSWNNKYLLACQATKILCDTLKKLQINHAVHHFTTPSDTYGSINYETKSWREQVNQTELTKRLVLLEEHQDGNGDSDALIVAYRELAKQKTARKIMIVLSDGEPAGWKPNINYPETTKAVVKELQTKCGLYSIGIMSTSVERFYANNVVLTKAKDLPAALLEVLKKALLHKET